MLGYRKRMVERAASLGHGHSQAKNNLSVQQCYHLHWPCKKCVCCWAQGAYKPYIIYGRTFRCEVVVLWNMLEKFVWYVGSTLTLNTRNIFALIVYLSSLILLASDVAGRNTWVALGTRIVCSEYLLVDLTHYSWRFKSCDKWRSVPDVSKERKNFIFSVKQSKTLTAISWR